MKLRYGYNTNGMAHHRLEDALRLLADLGYDGCAITLDHAHLDPFAPSLASDVERIGQLARQLGLTLTVETGARFLLDPARKHHPALISDDPSGRARRVDFLRRAVAIARDLGASVVSIWSGVPTVDMDRELAWSRLIGGLSRVLDDAERCDVVLGFEPEPGMLVDGVSDFRRLERLFPSLRLTLDLGHCHLTETSPPATVLRALRKCLATVHAEDMRRPRHEHLAFGDGEMDYPPILESLREIGYDGLVCVELSRDSHRAPEMARAAIEFLRRSEAATLAKGVAA